MHVKTITVDDYHFQSSEDEKLSRVTQTVNSWFLLENVLLKIFYLNNCALSVSSTADTGMRKHTQQGWQAAGIMRNSSVFLPFCWAQRILGNQGDVSWEYKCSLHGTYRLLRADTKIHVCIPKSEIHTEIQMILLSWKKNTLLQCHIPVFSSSDCRK